MEWRVSLSIIILFGSAIENALVPSPISEILCSRTATACSPRVYTYSNFKDVSSNVDTKPNRLGVVPCSGSNTTFFKVFGQFLSFFKKWMVEPHFLLRSQRHIDNFWDTDWCPFLTHSFDQNNGWKNGPHFSVLASWVDSNFYNRNLFCLLIFTVLFMKIIWMFQWSFWNIHQKSHIFKIRKTWIWIMNVCGSHAIIAELRGDNYPRTPKTRHEGTDFSFFRYSRTLEKGQSIQFFKALP